ncbi:MAG TPA: hypothetical protein VIC25_02415 [Caulobacteraceae bacterium]|jgi:hypothetical protein
MFVNHHRPPIVAQTLVDSCWAAALDSWSQADPHIPHHTQAGLITLWGEGATGGITPAAKIPHIAQTLGLAWGGFDSAGFSQYVYNHIAEGYLFCAYTRQSYTHAVIFYALDNTQARRGQRLSFMDPDGGHYRHHSLDWFESRGPFVLMRKA